MTKGPKAVHYRHFQPLMHRLDRSCFSSQTSPTVQNSLVDYICRWRKYRQPIDSQLSLVFISNKTMTVLLPKSTRHQQLAEYYLQKRYSSCRRVDWMSLNSCRSQGFHKDKKGHVQSIGKSAKLLVSLTTSIKCELVYNGLARQFSCHPNSHHFLRRHSI